MRLILRLSPLGIKFWDWDWDFWIESQILRLRLRLWYFGLNVWDWDWDQLSIKFRDWDWDFCEWAKTTLFVCCQLDMVLQPYLENSQNQNHIFFVSWKRTNGSWKIFINKWLRIWYKSPNKDHLQNLLF